jgi:3-oxoacyl-[acyl-carrier-protein] synthase-3
MLVSKIIATGSYLPGKIVSNNDLSKIVDTSDEWITSRTGIKSRHIADNNEFTSDLAAKSLEDALTNYNLSPNDIDGIIVATTTPDLVFPSTATLVQQKVGVKKGFAYDINAVCSGFIYALSIADSMLKNKLASRIAVIGAETMSRILDWNDRSTCILFGDGAGTVILEASQSTQQSLTGILYNKIEADGTYSEILKVDGGVSKIHPDAKLTMSGREVFKNAIDKMSSSILQALEALSLTLDDLDYVILHQANQRIIEAVQDKLGVDAKKMISTIENHGNTSAASIPLALDNKIKSNIIKKGDTLAFAAIGAGITWGCSIIKL